MGNTPNNNFPYPEATGLVKDGAQNIEDLAAAIDTTLGVYSPATPGLVKISTTSFSGVTSQSFNSIFSATYDNYKITFEAIGSTNISGNIRMRASGTDNTTASSYITRQLIGSGIDAISQTATSTSWLEMFFLTTEKGVGSFEFFNPFLAVNTNILGIAARDSVIATSNGRHNSSVSFDGFSLICPSGTMTGSVSVFGYAK